MNAERYRQVDRIFQSAIEREPHDRAAFLDEACAGDSDLRHEVDALIESYEQAGSFIESPLLEANREQMTGSILGKSFGSYEVLSLLGSGGMGEVYLAEDTRLGRKIALKLLPAFYTADEQRLKRFRQEARAASALNHPNIVTIFEIGQAGGVHYIATEYIQGETLRAHLSNSRMSVTAALEVATQVANALEAAHAAGIVHRDIKPENIMLRPDGYVKLLDFGLAKLTEIRDSTADAEAATMLKVSTSPGLVMGTVSYMSPEQARGKKVDARTDVFSLGVVIFEMITGCLPFEGETTSDVIAAILGQEPPPLVRFSNQVPETLDWIVTKALMKRREERYQTATEMLSDLRRLKKRLEFEAEHQRIKSRDLNDAGDRPTVKTTAEPTAQGADKAAARTAFYNQAESQDNAAARASTDPALKHKTRTDFTVSKSMMVKSAIALVIIAAAAFALWMTRSKQAPKESVRVVKTSRVTNYTGLDTFPTLSPDGNSIAYCSDHSDSFQIYVKALTPGAREIQLTTEGKGNFSPAWSPDGLRIAYYSKDRGGIWIIPASGGAAKQLTEFGARPAWSRDGSLIAFQSNGLTDLGASARTLSPSTIWVVSSQGGEARQITKVGNPPGGHGAPSWSPDGKRIVFEAGGVVLSYLWSVSIDGNDLKLIVPDEVGCYNPVYSPDGESIYYNTQSGGIWNIPVSPVTGEPTGKPVESAGAKPAIIRHLTITADGKKMACTGMLRSSNVWSVSLLPKTGAATGAPFQITQNTSTRNSSPLFSPDGRKIAYTSYSMNADVWVANADGKSHVQVTTNPAADVAIGWFPNMDQIAFVSNRDGRRKPYAITLASGKERLLFDIEEELDNCALSPDGRQLAFNCKRDDVINICAIPIEGGQPVQLTFDKELMGWPCWSPDGKYLGFELKRGEDTQVAFMPSGGGAITQMTFDHGDSFPGCWSPDGDKIVFAGQRNGYWNLFWVSRTTGEQKQLTNYSKLNAFVRYPAWSPLGNQIAYEYTETTGNIWLMELK